MKTCAEIRHENLKKLIERAGSLQVVADKLEKSHAQISQLHTQAKHSKTGKPRTVGDDTARWIEEKFGLEVGWMDNIHQQTADSPVPLPARPSAAWPFEGIDQRKVLALDPPDINRLEGALLLAAGQMHLDIAHIPKSIRAQG